MTQFTNCVVRSRDNLVSDVRSSAEDVSGMWNKFSRLFAGFCLGCLAATGALANPQGPNVVAGQAGFANPAPNVLNVTNSPGAIINWQAFGINPNEVTRFIQQSGASAVLNRVVGQDPSAVLGQLLSNGRVFLINPNGIVFGPSAVVDTAGLVASSLNITNEDFLSGTYRFTGDGDSGSVENQGLIKAGANGDVFLIAPSIENSGIIESDGGDLVLAAGRSVLLTSLDAVGVTFEVQAPEDAAVNLGQLLSAGGAAAIFAGTLRHSGDINVDAVSVDEYGQVLLFAQTDISVEAGASISASAGRIALTANRVVIAGTIDASADNDSGGTVEIDGKGWVALGGNIDASGTTGGTINVNAGGLSLAEQMLAQGSSGRGGDININATGQTTETSTSFIDVSGASGGAISHIAEQQITTSGTYLAVGDSGNGGTIDVSATATKILSSTFDASGETGGGRVRLGGEFQGGKDLNEDDLSNAATLVATDATDIRADALGVDGNGGEVIIWSTTRKRCFSAGSRRDRVATVATGDSLRSPPPAPSPITARWRPGELIVPVRCCSIRKT